LILDVNPPLAVIRELFIEYSETPGVDLCLKTFNEEMRTLPEPYHWFVAGMEGDTAAGCAALRRLDGEFAELKRLYVRPAFRGSGLARRMMLAAIAEARESGFQGLRLDTLPTMAPAIRLYQSLGFREIGHYGKQREPGLLYFELRY
jgi:ribosomal protein S18 acetylase RimI-like enzyme